MVGQINFESQNNWTKVCWAHKLRSKVLVQKIWGPKGSLWIKFVTKDEKSPKGILGHLNVFSLCFFPERGGHTGLWNIGMLHFNPNRSFQSQMNQKLFNLIPKVVIVATKSFKDFCFVFERFYLKNLRDFLWNALTLSIFELEKRSFFLNRSEFRQKLIGAIIRVLMRHPQP